MLAQPKISPLLPYTISLSSSYNHQAFLCKAPKFPLTLYLNSLLEDQEDQFHAKIKEQKNLVKIFKGLKYIKKIRQDDLVLHKMRLPLSKTKYLIKKARRVQILDIQDHLTSTKKSPARLDLWLKHGTNLRSVNYQFVPQLLAFETSLLLFGREIEQCLKYLPQHHSLTTFKIRLASTFSKVLESLLEFQRYPLSLKNLAIYQQKSEDPKISSDKLMISAFSRLKSLESLTLSGPNLTRVAETLLSKVSALSNIKKLNVQVFQVKPFGRTFNLNTCQTLQNLRSLKISNIAEGKDLSKLTNPPSQLESLDITAAVGLPGLELISQFLGFFNKSLRSLKIDIQHFYQTESEEKIQEILFSKISQLEKLTSFKFKVKNTAPPVSHQALKLPLPEILENLRGLFLKPVKLESFEWEVPQISSPEILVCLLKLLEGSCLTLKKLKMSFPFMEFEKSQESQLVNFLRKLESIEDFYLTSFGIKEEVFWVNLVNCFMEMKSLRALGLGCFTKGLEEEWVTKPLRRILQKRGLEVLEIDSSFGCQFGQIEEEPLDLKEIMRRNPALRKVSRNVRELFNTAGLE